MCVLFDLDNTIIDRNGAFQSFVTLLTNDLGKQAELLKADDGGYGERNRLYQLFDSLGYPIDQPTFAKEICAHLEPDRELNSELLDLSKDCKIGLVTNGGSLTQRAKIRAVQVGNIFSEQHIFISQELGVAKPDPSIFLQACDQMKADPEQCLMIGDREIEDGGCRTVGMKFHLVKEPLTATELKRIRQVHQI